MFSLIVLFIILISVRIKKIRSDHLKLDLEALINRNKLQSQNTSTQTSFVKESEKVALSSPKSNNLTAATTQISFVGDKDKHLSASKFSDVSEPLSVERPVPIPVPLPVSKLCDISQSLSVERPLLKPEPIPVPKNVPLTGDTDTSFKNDRPSLPLKTIENLPFEEKTTGKDGDKSRKDPFSKNLEFVENMLRKTEAELCNIKADMNEFENALKEVDTHEFSISSKSHSIEENKSNKTKEITKPKSKSSLSNVSSEISIDSQKNKKLKAVEPKSSSEHSIDQPKRVPIWQRSKPKSSSNTSLSDLSEKYKNNSKRPCIRKQKSKFVPREKLDIPHLTEEEDILIPVPLKEILPSEMDQPDKPSSSRKIVEEYDFGKDPSNTCNNCQRPERITIVIESTSPDIPRHLSPPPNSPISPQSSPKKNTPQKSFDYTNEPPVRDKQSAKKGLSIQNLPAVDIRRPLVTQKLPDISIKSTESIKEKSPQFNNATYLEFVHEDVKKPEENITPPNINQTPSPSNVEISPKKMVTIYETPESPETPDEAEKSLSIREEMNLNIEDVPSVRTLKEIQSYLENRCALIKKRLQEERELKPGEFMSLRWTLNQPPKWQQSPTDVSENKQGTSQKKVTFNEETQHNIDAILQKWNAAQAEKEKKALKLTETVTNSCTLQSPSQELMRDEYTQIYSQKFYLQDKETQYSVASSKTEQKSLPLASIEQIPENECCIHGCSNINDCYLCKTKEEQEKTSSQELKIVPSIESDNKIQEKSSDNKLKQRPSVTFLIPESPSKNSIETAVSNPSKISAVLPIPVKQKTSQNFSTQTSFTNLCWNIQKEINVSSTTIPSSVTITESVCCKLGCTDKPTCPLCSDKKKKISEVTQTSPEPVPEIPIAETISVPIVTKSVEDVKKVTENISTQTSPLTGCWNLSSIKEITLEEVLKVENYESCTSSNKYPEKKTSSYASVSLQTSPLRTSQKSQNTSPRKNLQKSSSSSVEIRKQETSSSSKTGSQMPPKISESITSNATIKDNNEIHCCSICGKEVSVQKITDSRPGEKICGTCSKKSSPENNSESSKSEQQNRSFVDKFGKINIEDYRKNQSPARSRRSCRPNKISSSDESCPRDTFAYKRPQKKKTYSTPYGSTTSSPTDKISSISPCSSDVISLSDGEVKLPCECSTSIGEIHICHFANKIRKNVRRFKKHEGLIAKDNCDSTKKPFISRQVKHYDNWVTYYITKDKTLSSGEVASESNKESTVSSSEM